MPNDPPNWLGGNFLGHERTRFIVEDGRKAWRSAHKSCRRRFELGSNISSNDGLVTALPIITIREPVCGFVQESRRNSRYNPKSLITGSGTCNVFVAPLDSCITSIPGASRPARQYVESLRSRQQSTDPGQFWDEVEIRLLGSEAEATILHDPIFPAENRSG